MRVLTYEVEASALRMRAVLRGIAGRPPPRLRGLRSRHWRVARGKVQGRYLFEDEQSLEEFRRAPSTDSAYLRIGEVAERLPDVACDEEIGSLDIFEHPIFIISAPRAGSTLLYELLAKAGGIWTIDGESEGVVEGIPALHVANRSFDSHRLTDADLSDEIAADLRAGFIAELRDRYGRRYLEFPYDARPAKLRVLEKTPENSLRVAFLAAVFPNARFIFLHRDARQSVSSILEAWHHDGFINIPALPGWSRGAWHLLLPAGWRERNGASLLDVAAFQWNAANLAALTDLETVAREQWTSVDYDELVAAPGDVVRRLCDFAEITLDKHLAQALERPLPLAGTTISPPSPIKWRSNREFSESVLERYALTRARLRDLGRISAPPPPARNPNVPVRFSCFLDQIDRRPTAPGNGWIVAPSFYFQIGATLPTALLRRTRFRERFRTDFPILWIEDPKTCVVYPVWILREQALLFREFAAGRPPPTHVSDELTHRLIAAGVLVTSRCLEERRHEGDDLVQEASQYFEERRYCMLPALLGKAHATAIGRYYDELIAYGEWAAGDEQVRLRHGQHNEPISRYFHHQLAAFVGRVAGEAVKPTYAYVSAYKEGAALRAHVDRKQCVFTLSIWINRGSEPSNEPWPLWFQTDHGKVAVTQTAGDGVLFRGCELPHWRDRPPPGGSSTTLLFHYVPKDFVGVLD